MIMIPRRGAEVAQISWKSLKDVLEVRSALDALAIELACERMGQDDLELLYKACERFEQATETKDTRIFPNKCTDTGLSISRTRASMICLYRSTRKCTAAFSVRIKKPLQVL